MAQNWLLVVENEDSVPRPFLFAVEPGEDSALRLALEVSGREPGELVAAPVLPESGLGVGSWAWDFVPSPGPSSVGVGVRRFGPFPVSSPSVFVLLWCGPGDSRLEGAVFDSKDSLVAACENVVLASGGEFSGFGVENHPAREFPGGAAAWLFFGAPLSWDCGVWAAAFEFAGPGAPSF